MRGDQVYAARASGWTPIRDYGAEASTMSCNSSLKSRFASYTLRCRYAPLPCSSRSLIPSSSESDPRSCACSRSRSRAACRAPSRTPCPATAGRRARPPARAATRATCSRRASRTGSAASFLPASKCSAELLDHRLDQRRQRRACARRGSARPSRGSRPSRSSDAAGRRTRARCSPPSRRPRP